MVKMTMISVVVTMICRVSRDSRFRCRLSANDTAPRRPIRQPTQSIAAVMVILTVKDNQCRRRLKK